MPFSDDDLKRLKEIIEANTPRGNCLCNLHCAIDAYLYPLIARLEAAEELSEIRRIYMGLPQDEFDTSDGDGPILYEHMKEADKVWRKAAGKND